MKTLEQLCAAALAREATQQAIEFEGRWYSWGEMRQVADRVAQLLAQCGAHPQAAVTFVPRNRPSALAALLALVAQGRDVRMLYAFQSATALARQLKRHQPAVVIAAEREFSPEVCEVLRTSGIAGIAIAEMDAHFVVDCEHSKVVSDAGPVARQIEILTSGTTGTPKQFPISYALIEKFMVGDVVRAGQSPDFSSEPPALLYFPLGNITGIYSSIPPLMKGQRAVLLDRFALEQWHDYVVRYRPTTSGIPPAAMRALLDADIPAADLASLKSMGSGAAPLDPSIQRAFEARYGIPILLSYGATEFGGPVTAMTVALHAEWGEAKFGSVGRAFPGFDVRVVDAATNAELPSGEEGILEVVSPRIGADWIRTSDVAVLDADGFLFLRGRADGAIMRGGFKVLPETIERALLLHPAIAAASVVGVADARLAEVPGAAIQIRAGYVQPDVAELETHLRSHLLATQIPVQWRFVDDLPKTPSFKVDRPAVKRLFVN
jgi:acyl-coenzyme A synthetase/AMP-(fatty) acid ligase